MTSVHVHMTARRVDEANRTATQLELLFDLTSWWRSPLSWPSSVTVW